MIFEYHKLYFFENIKNVNYYKEAKLSKLIATKHNEKATSKCNRYYLFVSILAIFMSNPDKKGINYVVREFSWISEWTNRDNYKIIAIFFLLEIILMKLIQQKIHYITYVSFK